MVSSFNGKPITNTTGEVFLGFAELVCQSNFTFLQGGSHPEELVRQAYFLGYDAIAITDECSVAGVVRAYTEINQNHLPIKLIVGSKFVFNGQTLTFICPTKKAYKECCRIITNARRRAIKGEYELSEWDIKSCKYCFCLWQPAGEQKLPENQQAENKAFAIWLQKCNP